MGVNLQEFVNNEVIGNVRSGTRGEKDEPKKLSCFDVHLDKSTSALAVEIFNQKYNKPKVLKIRFLSQHPMEVFLERYDGKRRKCYGNSKQAKYIDNNGRTQTIECKGEKCSFFEEKKCKYAGKLYFIIENLEDEGIWCYPIGSQKGIKRIAKRIARANSQNEDLTKDWYELFLQEEDAPIAGKNYIPDIRKLDSIDENTNVSSKASNTKNSKPKNNYLMIIGMEKVIEDDKEKMRIKFKDTNLNDKELFILPEGKLEILKLKPKSIIELIDVNGNILKDYRIVKDISKEQNKKAS